MSPTSSMRRAMPVVLTDVQGKPLRGRFRKPRLLAAIDVGSTAVRMEVAQLKPDGSLQPVDQLVHPIAIGTDTFREGYIAASTAKALTEVLTRFARVLKEYGISECHTVATSALREATNRDVLVDRIHHDSGLSVRILDAAEESRLTYQMLLPFLRQNGLDAEDHALVLDLGGGSTEIMVLEGLRVQISGARRFGTSRLILNASRDDETDSRILLDSMISSFVSSAEELYREIPVRECLVINTTLAGLFSRDEQAETIPGGLRLPLQPVWQAIEDVTSLPRASLAERFGLGPSETELLLPTFLVLSEFLRTIPVSRLFLPRLDFLTGVLIDASLNHFGVDPLDTFRDHILSATLSLAERYNVHGAHALQVRRLSRQLFDVLAGYLGLTTKDRLYLEVAALLHDIGRFINDCDHHKHGAYIVQHSELLGFSEEEHQIIALIVRYHRKGRPRLTHGDFARLTTTQRLQVSKLAALLRIADALDRDHEERVRQLHVEIGEAELNLGAEATGDLSIEKAALRSKGAYFEELTGLTLNLRRHMS